MTTTSDEVWRLLGELIQAQKETDRILKEQAQESEKRFQETDRLIKEQNRQLNQQIGKLGNRLGEFVEWQVRPAAVRLFQQHGIIANYAYRRGLFVLAQSGDSVIILNDAQFQPQAW